MVGSFPQDIQTAHLLTIPHHTSLKNLIILLLKTLVHLRLLYKVYTTKQLQDCYTRQPMLQKISPAVYDLEQLKFSIGKIDKILT